MARGRRGWPRRPGRGATGDAVAAAGEAIEAGRQRHTGLARNFLGALARLRRALPDESQD